MGMNKLTVFNFKSIDKMEISPEGKSFTLKGKNGAGKSAVIEAIEWALRGGSALSKGAIKNGEDYTEVIYESDEFNITRKWKRGKNPSIKVTDKDGKIWTSPQSMLDDIVSNLSFDPMAFLLLNEKAQLESLKGLIDPDGVIDKMESEKQTIYDNRTVAGREEKRLQGAFDTLPHYPDAPDIEVLSDVLLKNLNDAQAVHAKSDELARSYNEKNDKLDALESDIEEYEAEIKKIQSSIKNAKEQAVKMKTDIRKDSDAIAEIGELPNIEPLEQAFTDADETNKQVRANLARKVAQHKLLEAVSVHADLEQKHVDFNVMIDTFIRKQKLPVDGLSFSPDCLMLDAKRFSDCSDGERLRTSVLISMAMNPGLKIIAIKNASLLDDASKKIIFDLAREHGYQVIMEVVKSGELECEIEQEFIDEEVKNA